MQIGNNPLVSIVIPVYNVESYLVRCVQSVQGQTYSNLEIILINDGSTDNCPAICDELSKNDHRIKVIHQQNLGSGAARNAGLEVFKGDWVCFIDSDDWIESTYIETLLYAAVDNNCLMSTCKMRCAFFEIGEVVHPAPEIKLFAWNNYYMYICGKQYSYSEPGYTPWPMAISLFSQKIAKQHRFLSHPQGEDAATVHLFVHSCAENNSLIAVSNLCLYTYFQRSESNSRGKNKNKNWFSLIDALEVELKFFKQKAEKALYDIYLQFYYSFCIDVACECSRDIPQFKSEIEGVIERVRKGKTKAFANANPRLTVSLGAKYNREILFKENIQFVLYGYGRNGMRLLEWLRYFNIPIIEIWDVSAFDGQIIYGIPVKKMHKELSMQNVQILCSIQDPAIYYPVLYELRVLGYSNIMPFNALDNAVRYATYERFLPFLLED